MWEERGKLKTELFHKRNQNLQIWKILSIPILQKWESLCIESKQGVTGQPLAYEIRLWLTDPVMMAAETGNRDSVTQDRSVEGPPVWWLGPLRTAWEADKVLENSHRQKHCQLKLNRDRITEGRLLDSWEATGWASRAVWLPTCIIHQEKGRMILKTKQRSAGASLSPWPGEGAVPPQFLRVGHAAAATPRAEGGRARSQRELSLGLKRTKQTETHKYREQTGGCWRRGGGGNRWIGLTSSYKMKRSRECKVHIGIKILKISK